MSTLVEIAQGWYNFIRQKPAQKIQAIERLEICDTCPQKQQMSGLGVLLVQTINEAGSIYKCAACGCSLQAKVFSPDSKCPLNKW